MKKIERLSPEQEARFPAYVEEWKGHGLCTAPADRPRAEAAIRLMYDNAGLKAPRIVWTQSPLGNALALHVMRDKAVWASVGDSVRASVGASVGDSVRASVGDSVGDSVRASVGASVWDSVWDSVRASVGDSVGDSVRASVWDSVWDSVRASVGDSVRASVWDSVGDSVGDSVRASVGDSVWDSVGASVGDSVRASVGDSVWDSVWDSVRDSVRASVGDSVWDSVGASVGDSVRASVGASVWDSVGASVGDSVRASVGASVWDSVYGAHDAHWLAFYRFFHDECGLRDETAALAGLWELCQSAGWALPYAHVCFVSERHDICKLDADGRIHAEDGPAIRYPDGFSIYAWRGTRIPPEWIENKASLTARTALTHPNVEQRRAACEILGWDTILRALNARTIDADGDPEIGELVEVEIPDIGTERFLRVQCGTGRRFALPVPPDMHTALQANAWTYGLEANDFTPPEVRT